MLKLTRHLFEWEAEARTADYYERALFNHIFSSQNPLDGRVIYNLSLEMGGHKVYQDPHSFSCCVGTGMENHAKYARNIYFYNNQELFVAQYIASELQWEEKKLVLRQKTQYLNEEGTILNIHCEEPVQINLRVRYPAWATKGIHVWVNNKEVKVAQKPGSFISMDRKWENGDQVKVKFPYHSNSVSEKFFHLVILNVYS